MLPALHITEWRRNGYHAFVNGQCRHVGRHCWLAVKKYAIMNMSYRHDIARYVGHSHWRALIIRWRAATTRLMVNYTLLGIRDEYYGGACWLSVIVDIARTRRQLL